MCYCHYPLLLGRQSLLALALTWYSRGGVQINKEGDVEKIDSKNPIMIRKRRNSPLSPRNSQEDNEEHPGAARGHGERKGPFTCQLEFKLGGASR